MNSKHVSVLLPETIALLSPKKDGIYVDLTLGRAGTSSAILEKIPEGHLYSFDLDNEAIEESKERLSKIGSNFTILHSNFAFFKEELAKLGVTKVDGITADLGVSSPQFDEGERGFSYRVDAPLDMRMDESATKSAKTILNTYDETELSRIFRLYGEDPDSRRIARLIVKRRALKPIETTGELVEIIKEAKPYAHKKGKGHPAKQVFQALRIETNGELENLKALLRDFDSVLAPKGRIAIITFHSLEDRLVKSAFRALSRVEGSRIGPDLLPDELEEAPYIDLTPKAIAPSLEEETSNLRSRSAHLRGIEKKEERP